MVTSSCLAGNVGIGASPQGLFHVSSTTTGNLAFRVDARDWSGVVKNNALMVSSSGNVGVWTSAPAALLDIRGDLQSPAYAESGLGINLIAQNGYGNGNTNGGNIIDAWDFILMGARG
ncbi:hypothetical protein CCP3SC1_2550002 [Gammaproteobacteria bacterium]